MKKLTTIFFLLIISLIGSEHQFTGRHYTASYVSCDHKALCNIPQLKEAMFAAVEASGATILDTSEFLFAPYGFTMVILLSESHASIHTYPEYNSCYIDLFTCGDGCDHNEFEKVLQRYLSPKTINNHLMRR